MNGSEHKLANVVLDWLLRHRRGLLIGTLLVVCVAAWPASQLTLNESIQSFYAPNDPELVAWLDSKEWFGGDEFVMVAYEDDDLLSAENLGQLQVFADQFRDPKIVPGIDNDATQDLASTLDLNRSPMFQDMSPLIRNIIGRVLRSSLIEFSRSVLVGGPDAALCRAKVGDWQRMVLDQDAALDELAIEETGIHADYSSGEHQISVYAYATRARDLDDVVEAAEPALHDAGFEVEAFAPADVEAGPLLTFQRRQPHSLGQVCWQEDWMFVFTTAAPIDLAAFVNEFLPGVAYESNTTAVMLRMQPEDEAPVSRGETLARIRELAAEHDPPAYVAGEPVQIHDMFRYVEEDASVLGWATSGLLLVVILVMFRSIRWVVLPLLVVHAAIVGTRAILVLSGMQLSMVSSMLSSLVTIIGIATVTHVTVTFRELRADHDRVAAFRETFHRLAPAVFWTCVTTALGFLSLLSSEIVPVQSFGIMIGLGTMLVLVMSAVLLPGGVLLGSRDPDPGTAPIERHLVRSLLAVTDWVEKRPFAWLGVAGVLALVSAAGLSRLRVETDFSKNFRSSSEIAVAVNFFESNLGGAGNWEVSFPAPATLDEEFLDQVRDLARRLREIEMDDGTQLSKVYALTDGLDFIPPSMGSTIEERRRSLREVQPNFESQLYNPEHGRMRLYLRAREQKPAEIKLALIERVEAEAREVFPEARTTGLYVLIAKLVTSLLGDQVKSFTIAAVAIVLAMTVAYRSLWIGIASLVPNVFPILLVIGGMGWLGVPINIGTAMIACVSMGLTVDSSIHYLTGYRRERELGKSHLEAIRETHVSVGRALVFANVALIIGFTVLVLSNFIPLVYFGVLVSLAMFGGLLGNLILLPLVLRWVPLKVQSAGPEGTFDV